MIKKITILLILAILFNVVFYAFVWSHRLFVTGLNPVQGLLAFVLFLLISIPIIVFAVIRLARYYKDNIGFDPATLFVLGSFIFMIGYFFNELPFGSSSVDLHLRDTYVVIDQSYVMIFLALIFLAFSAVYYFYPRMTGRVMNTPMGYIHFGITLIGAYLLFWPVQYPNTGLAGMPRRYIDYSNWTVMDRFARINVFKMRMTVLLICAQLLFIVNLVYSAMKGQKWNPA